MEQRGWCDVMGGSTGVVVDSNSIHYKGISIAEVKNIPLPAIAQFKFGGTCEIKPGCNNRTRPPLGGGSKLPGGIGERVFSIKVCTGSFKGVALSLEQDNSHWFQTLAATKNPNLTNLAFIKKIYLKVELHARLPEGETMFASYADKYRQELDLHAQLVKYLGLPIIPYDLWTAPEVDPRTVHGNFPKGSIHCAFLYGEEHNVLSPYLGYTFKYDSIQLPQWDDIILRMQNWMNTENVSYNLNSLANYGQMNWFAGYPQCVTLEAQDLLQRECANPQYDTYNVSYMKLEPESWDIREKRRKKVTEPRFMQLGTCELENGCKLTLRLKMLKEGYVVYLDFPSEDDMSRFAETDIYRMMQWENSVE